MATVALLEKKTKREITSAEIIRQVRHVSRHRNFIFLFYFFFIY